MAKKIQILMMIFCLGIFIFPKQNFILHQKRQTAAKQKKIVVANLKKNLATVKKMTKIL
jgi:hypothetical protein